MPHTTPATKVVRVDLDEPRRSGGELRRQLSDNGRACSLEPVSAPA